MQPLLGVIGGTGCYELPGIKIRSTLALETPYGAPSDEYIIGEHQERLVIFLPRHGRGHRLNPSKINYRANIWGMKKLGVTHLVTVSAVGSFKEEIRPGTLVLVDQFIDRTKTRGVDTFFEDLAVHIAFADPVCPVLHRALSLLAQELQLEYTERGIYLNIEGPAFSTRAESRIYRSWGADVIGMTNLYEAKLAREAELHFAAIAEVTDYDSWREEAVDVPTIIGNLGRANAAAVRLLTALVERFPLQDGVCNCEKALAQAIVTHRAHIPEDVKKKNELLLSKYL